MRYEILRHSLSGRVDKTADLGVMLVNNVGSDVSGGQSLVAGGYNDRATNRGTGSLAGML